jgi:hypothetical protein
VTRLSETAEAETRSANSVATLAPFLHSPDPSILLAFDVAPKRHEM